jgi:hypothetical protein
LASLDVPTLLILGSAGVQLLRFFYAVIYKFESLMRPRANSRRRGGRSSTMDRTSFNYLAKADFLLYDLYAAYMQPEKQERLMSPLPIPCWRQLHFIAGTC